MIPILEPVDCARTIIDAMRRNERTVFVPRRLEPLMKLLKVFPRSVQFVLDDFLNCRVAEKY
jgi:hypothetical protein